MSDQPEKPYENNRPYQPPRHAQPHRAPFNKFNNRGGSQGGGGYGGVNKFGNRREGDRYGDRDRPQRTEWSHVAEWYDTLVGPEGTEYQQKVVHPGTLKLLGDVRDKKVLDIACGQGVFSRALYLNGATVTGLDGSGPLIEKARRYNDDMFDHDHPKPQYAVADARDFASVERASFDAAVLLLAVQDIDPFRPVFEHTARVLKPGGTFVIVMMHPAFRAPKVTSWQWDLHQDVQYRRVDQYLIPRKTPIITNPGKDKHTYTWTFHRPLSQYITTLGKCDLLVDTLAEWPSHKVSEPGPRARMENTAREEIPLFAAIRAIRK